MKNIKYDIVLIGAGPASLAFCQSLAQENISIAIIEKASTDSLLKPKTDGREIFLNNFSINFLQNINIWSLFNDKDISFTKKAIVYDNKIDSSFTIGDDNNSHFGCYIPNNIIKKQLAKLANMNNKLEIYTETSYKNIISEENKIYIHLDKNKILETKLLIASDGRFSNTRMKMGIACKTNNFAKSMIISRVNHKKDIKGITYQCFLYNKTMAILPIAKNLSSIAITTFHNKASELNNLDDKQYCKYIEKGIGKLLGEIEKPQKRYTYPLVSVLSETIIQKRFALLGDSCAGLHPATASSFNLSLKAVSILANNIKKAKQLDLDIGSYNILSNYEKKITLTMNAMYYGSNSLVHIFNNETKLFKKIRPKILDICNNLPFTNRIISSIIN